MLYDRNLWLKSRTLVNNQTVLTKNFLFDFYKSPQNCYPSHDNQMQSDILLVEKNVFKIDQNRILFNKLLQIQTILEEAFLPYCVSC